MSRWRMSCSVRISHARTSPVAAASVELLIQRSRACVWGSFGVSRSRCHVSRACTVCVVGKAVESRRLCLSRSVICWNLMMAGLIAAHHTTNKRTGACVGAHPPEVWRKRDGRDTYGSRSRDSKMVLRRVYFSPEGASETGKGNIEDGRTQARARGSRGEQTRETAPRLVDG